ncbi:uncharacterized protein Z520_08882 [Fonsecaea multimorphosa CBS 102226]|uniref:Transcriptional regulatory protein RXT2 N-terminal domain-containing protein n=1 Tax=Fonsecaea multimorphosa CBS 102226 TaxID=1442371 RepID=A0A0D2H0N3_9EURO|nr:uncharacterized protein Z520_08882 [Fonsecaea multimorphosa CBS 102226]KIX95365.1 hypothetical protein Z520_08882 [Fonsecaea multimorphosa CBS 102226]OAL21033.1 hypothetical protein AYO22_08317 [Fonsecaea multimorphosa]
MPPQHVEIAETIAALKRTLRRERDGPTDQVTSAATNRGHKLARGANYIHAGALPYPHGQDGHKQKIEHAGYTRYILQRNPRRYNEFGDELEDSESDAEADADAEEENAYAGIRLEELLCPLKHPSELSSHPTLSLPFTDRALPDMIKSTEEKLRLERSNLWRAKNLNRQFMGDEPWMPLETTEGVDDWDLFDPKPELPTQHAGKKRKRGFENESSQNGVNGHNYANGGKDENVSNSVASVPETSPNTDDRDQAAKAGKSRPLPEITVEQSAKEVAGDQPEHPKTNGVHKGEDGPASKDETAEIEAGKEQDASITVEVDGQERQPEQEGDAASEDESQPKPTRRITRALAAEHNSSTAPTPPLSPESTVSSIDSSLLQPDPLFLLPPVLAANHRPPRSLARLGLPVDELMETRRLLMMYIQKQEESVRGYEAVLGKLIKAKRMRDKVWNWCRTEGHVGEWSDGEDWIDAEAWGLQPEELRKGKDEEVDEAQEDTGRKGKRRRRD